MLCPQCHVHTDRSFPYCVRCGRALASKGGAVATLPPAELHGVDDASAIFALSAATTAIGRNPDNDVVADDERVSRYHAHVVRDATGYKVADLDSLNGTFVNDSRLSDAAVLNDGDIVQVGRWKLRFEQPRPDDIAGKTVVSQAGATMMAAPGATGLHAGDPMAQADDRTEQLKAGQSSSAMEERPRRRSGWELKPLPVKEGQVRYILRNTRTDKFLNISERDRFIWDHLDGEQTLRDVVLAYARQYGTMAMPRIQAALRQFRGAGLLAVEAPTEEVSRGKRVRRAIFHALMKLEVSIKGIDPAMTTLYKAFAWRFFTRPGVVITWLLAFAGVAGFIQASRHQALFDVGGAGALGSIVAILGYVAALSVHELAHAMATKSYGRSVRRGGLMLTMGMPFAFVDTSSMWLEGRRARIAVSAAGPLATAAVGGLFALGAAFLPGTAWPAVCFNIAFGLYISTAFNMNPLIPLDGYLILSDTLEMPNLRQEATSYFKKGFWSDLKHPSQIRWGYFVFGFVAVIATFAFMALGIFMWRSRLGNMVHEHVPAPFDSIIIGCGIGLVFFPVWFPLSRRLVKLVRDRKGTGGSVVAADPIANTLHEETPA